MLLILLVLVLWKLGFFKRRRPDPTLSGNLEKHREADNPEDEALFKHWTTNLSMLIAKIHIFTAWHDKFTSGYKRWKDTNFSTIPDWLTYNYYLFFVSSYDTKSYNYYFSIQILSNTGGELFSTLLLYTEIIIIFKVFCLIGRQWRYRRVLKIQNAANYVYLLRVYFLSRNHDSLRRLE